MMSVPSWAFARRADRVSAFAVSELIRVDPSTRLEMKRFSSLEICVSIFQHCRDAGTAASIGNVTLGQRLRTF